MPEQPPCDDSSESDWWDERWAEITEAVDLIDEFDLADEFEVGPEVDADWRATVAEHDVELMVNRLRAADAAVAIVEAERLQLIDRLRATMITADELRASAQDAAQRARADRDGAGRSSAAAEYPSAFGPTERAGAARAAGGLHARTAVRSREISERSAQAEIALALGMSEGGASTLIHAAEQLCRRHPSVLAAMRVGEIRERHAIRLAGSIADLPIDAAERVVAAALPQADRAFSKFAAIVDRLVHREHPVSAEERHATALDDRAVWLTVHPDQMAELHVFGPAVEIHAAFNRLRSMAKTITRDPDETRTQGQATTDVVIDLLLDGSCESTSESVRGIRPTVFVTVPALSLATMNPTFGDAEIDGVGPIDLETATRLVGTASEWTRIITHPVTGMVLSVDRERYRPPAAIARLARWMYGTCTFPGCRTPAHRCELDHICPWSDGGGTGICNVHPLCTSHHTIRHATLWHPTPNPGGGVTWTSPGGQKVSTPPKAPWVDVFATQTTLLDAAPF